MYAVHQTLPSLAEVGLACETTPNIFISSDNILKCLFGVMEMPEQFQQVVRMLRTQNLFLFPSISTSASVPVDCISIGNKLSMLIEISQAGGFTNSTKKVKSNRSR